MQLDSAAFAHVGLVVDIQARVERDESRFSVWRCEQRRNSTHQ